METLPLEERRDRLHVRLEGFEGPLDLLLHLIRKHQLDVLDIPIAFITREYLRYLEAMEREDLAIAGEYLLMSAQLIWIKSRSLLPRHEEEEEESDEEADPRADLVRRLLEYQRYREAAEHLDRRRMMGRDVFVRPAGAAERSIAGPAQLLPLTLYELLHAFREMLRRVNRPELMHDVSRVRLSLRDTIHGIAMHLQASPRSNLLELMHLRTQTPSREDLVVTFLALLEMARMKMIRLFQARLTTRELIVERAVVRPEELEQQLRGLEIEPLE